MVSFVVFYHTELTRLANAGRTTTGNDDGLAERMGTDIVARVGSSWLEEH